MPQGDIKVSVKLHGADKLTKAFRTSPKWLGQEIERGLENSALSVQREAQILAPVDTGRLRGSITYELDKAPIPKFAKVGPTVEYGAFVEFGRRPNSAMPPVSALIPWLKRQGVSQNTESVAFLVARSIAKRGIKPKPYMRDGYKEAKRGIDKIWGKVARSIEMRWGRTNA